MNPDVQQVLTVTTDDGENMVDAVREVLRMLKKGYTSGYQPNWTLSDEQK